MDSPTPLPNFKALVHFFCKTGEGECPWPLGSGLEGSVCIIIIFDELAVSRMHRPSTGVNPGSVRGHTLFIVKMIHVHLNKWGKDGRRGSAFAISPKPTWSVQKRRMQSMRRSMRSNRFYRRPSLYSRRRSWSVVTISISSFSHGSKCLDLIWDAKWRKKTNENLKQFFPLVAYLTNFTFAVCSVFGIAITAVILHQFKWNFGNGLLLRDPISRETAEIVHHGL